MLNKFTKSPTVFSILTVLLGGFPFALYGVERKSGSLPSESVWYGTGVNHGPWRGRIESLALFYPTLVLIVLNGGLFLSRAVKTKNWRMLGFGLMLGLFQLACIAGQFYFLAWTID
jgi:hypothetical protein